VTPRIGIHTSIAGSLAGAAEKAASLDCQAFQIFSSSPRMWRASRLDGAEVRRFRDACERHVLHPLVIHTNYLVNLAAADGVIRDRSITAFRGELQRALALGARYLVLHPGSHRGQTLEQAIRTFARSIAKSARGLRLGGLQILLENTAGGGFTLGRMPDELLELRRLADLPIAFCLDTAHCFQAGLSFPSLLDALVDVPVIHTNDSRTPFGSRVDRHEHIGKGGIGRAGFRELLADPRLGDRTLILETPVEKPGDDRRNVRALRLLAAKV
jgi:deoxyribonuclease-4